MPMGNFLDDANAWLEDLTKPKVRPIVQMTPPDSTGYQTQATRKNPVNGMDQILVPDPDHPRQMIWVDALWNPLRDLMEPVDPKYRPKESDYYSMSSLMRNQFAGSNGFDFSGPLNVGPLPAGATPTWTIGQSTVGAASGSDNGGVWIVVGALLLVYLVSR